jgi:hypothetical protein
VQSGAQPGDSPTHNDGIIVFFHRKDYIPQTARIS